MPAIVLASGTIDADPIVMYALLIWSSPRAGARRDAQAPGVTRARRATLTSTDGRYAITPPACDDAAGIWIVRRGSRRWAASLDLVRPSRPAARPG